MLQVLKVHLRPFDRGGFSVPSYVHISVWNINQQVLRCLEGKRGRAGAVVLVCVHGG